uniref:CUB_2 domain-containing protein n=1 Tax=Caenorhabditis japonica TaxID=281687 RepID=A0A8R1DWE1_CAEJA
MGISVCPNDFITVEAGTFGVIPPGRVGLSVIPANYNCEYNFLILAGWALHFSISTHYDQLLGDEISFTDSLGEVHVLPTPNQHIDEWSGADNAVLYIRTNSNQSQMFAIYEFVDVKKKYQHVMIPTGEYFSLGHMTNQYYTFYSKARDKVALNLAVKNTQDYDSLLEFLFVYDGGDVKNSKMISRLSTFLRKHKTSTSHNLTIVNFWDVKSPSYLIGNDLSRNYLFKYCVFKSRIQLRRSDVPQKISKFSKYKAILTSRNQQTTGELFDASEQGAAYTWICSDCKHFYWTVLKLHKSKTTGSKAYIELRSLSPTYNTSTLLNYSISPVLNLHFPQLIPSRMFTMINHYSRIGVMLDTSNSSEFQQTNTFFFSTRFRSYHGKVADTIQWKKGNHFLAQSVGPYVVAGVFILFWQVGCFCCPLELHSLVNDNQKFVFGVNVRDIRIASSGESLTIKTGPSASENNSSFQEL